MLYALGPFVGNRPCAGRAHTLNSNRAMPDYRRTRFPGGLYFFTVVTHGRRSVLIDLPFRQLLGEAVRTVRARYPFRVIAWVLLPDHLHAIWRLPRGDADTGKRWSSIKGAVTRMTRDLSPVARMTSSRSTRGEGTLWQRRFWEHLIVDESDLRRHTDYVHFNPVKHGHVRRVAD